MPRGGGGHMGGGGRMGGGHMGGSHSSFGGGHSRSSFSGPRMSGGPRMSRGPMGGPMGPGPMMGPRHHYRGFYGRRYRRGGGFLASLIFMPAFFIFLALFMVGSIFGGFSSSSSYSSTNYEYIEEPVEKLTGVPAYNSNCIKDEVGWIQDSTTLNEGLEYFYDQTGIQPYVILTNDLDSYTNDLDQTYEKLFNSENGLVYIYEADTLHPTDYNYNDYYITGYDADGLFNVDYLWSNVENYWDEDNISKGLALAFEKTASDIMSQTITTSIPIVNDDVVVEDSSPSFGSIIARVGLIGAIVACAVLLIKKLTGNKNQEETTTYTSTDTSNSTDEEYNPYYGDSESYGDYMKTQNKE